MVPDTDQHKCIKPLVGKHQIVKENGSVVDCKPYQAVSKDHKKCFNPTINARQIVRKDGTVEACKNYFVPDAVKH